MKPRLHDVDVHACTRMPTKLSSAIHTCINSMFHICIWIHVPYVRHVKQCWYIYPPPLSRDRRGRGGAMSHSINHLFPLLTIHRVGVEVVNCQACPVDYVFQPCDTGPFSSPLAIHRPLQDSRRKVACSIYADTLRWYIYYGVKSFITRKVQTASTPA